MDGNLRQENVDRMVELELFGMAEALKERTEFAPKGGLCFDTQLAVLLDSERAERDWKSYLGHLRQAQLRLRAALDEVECGDDRGLDEETLACLGEGDWIRQGVNLIVEGPPGSGKSFLSCALGDRACRDKHSVLYRRVPELVGFLDAEPCGGVYERALRRLSRVGLLILDDWGLECFSVTGRRALSEIMERRHGRKSTLVASQVPVDSWPAVIGGAPIGEVLTDRIVSNAYRLVLRGESSPKRRPYPSRGSIWLGLRISRSALERV